MNIKLAMTRMLIRDMPPDHRPASFRIRRPLSLSLSSHPLPYTSPSLASVLVSDPRASGAKQGTWRSLDPPRVLFSSRALHRHSIGPGPDQHTPPQFWYLGTILTIEETFLLSASVYLPLVVVVVQVHDEDDKRSVISTLLSIKNSHHPASSVSHSTNHVYPDYNWTLVLLALLPLYTLAP